MIPKPETAPADAGRVYVVLEDGRVVAGSSGAPAAALYVQGHMEGPMFVAESDVLGEGAVEMDGERGWFELTTRRFYPAQTARPPVRPFVEGAMTPHRGFVPGDRRVQR